MKVRSFKSVINLTLTHTLNALLFVPNLRVDYVVKNIDKKYLIFADV